MGYKTTLELHIQKFQNWLFYGGIVTDLKLFMGQVLEIESSYLDMDCHETK